MKIQNRKTEVLIGIVATITTLMLSTTSPAFATSDTYSGPYSPQYEYPSYSAASCDGSQGETCASASSGGTDLLFATASYPGSQQSNADNNYNGNDTPPYGSSPTLSTSGPNIGFNAYVSYGSDITNPSNNSANAYYEIEPILFDSSTGGALKSCQYYDSTVGLASNSPTVSCSYSNSNYDQYYVGVQTLAYAAGTTSGSSTVDMWNTNSGYEETINSLTVCDDGTC